MREIFQGVLLSAVVFAFAGCGSGRLNVEREAAKSTARLNREAAKAKEARAANWGHFSGTVDARWEDDGRTMVLLDELRYTDPYGVVWIAPPGSRVDGASIPRAFWTVIGGPFEGKYRNASVLHDVAYDEQNRAPEDVDRMFYNAMRCSGVGVVTAKTMYYALVRHGRHWKHRQALPVDDSSTVRPSAPGPGDVDEIQRWIRANDPDLDQIDARAAKKK